MLLGYLSDRASPQVFERIPTSEIECLANHACNIFTPLITNRNWTKTGVLQKVDRKLLQCLIPHMKHKHFVTVALQAKLLHVIADLCAARTPGMPCPDVTHAILGITTNARSPLMLAGWENERIFK
jgi:hypothetical protein